jgi:hypothetical protein
VPSISLDRAVPPPLLADLQVFLAGLASLQPAPISVARFLLDHGQVFTPQPLPLQYDLGPAKLCYMNASQLVVADHALRYAEGYVVSPRTGNFPLEHAWAVTPSNHVIDNTVPNPQANLYFGVAFPAHDLFKWLMASEVYGVFGGHRPWVERVLAGDSLAVACQSDLMVAETAPEL